MDLSQAIFILEDCLLNRCDRDEDAEIFQALEVAKQYVGWDKKIVDGNQVMKDLKSEFKDDTSEITQFWLNKIEQVIDKHNNDV